jgi:hypothetical protein
MKIKLILFVCMIATVAVAGPRYFGLVINKNMSAEHRQLVRAKSRAVRMDLREVNISDLTELQYIPNTNVEFWAWCWDIERTRSTYPKISVTPASIRAWRDAQGIPATHLECVTGDVPLLMWTSLNLKLKPQPGPNTGQ